MKTRAMEVFGPLLVGVLAGYTVAWLVVRRDPTGKDGALERGGWIALLGVAAFVVIILLVEVHVEDMGLKRALRSLIIAVATAAFTTVVSAFLMYAKNDPD